MKPPYTLNKNMDSGGDELSSFSDLMTALMLVFLLVSVALLSRTKIIKDILEAKELELHEAQHEIALLHAERNQYTPFRTAFESAQVTRSKIASRLTTRMTDSDLSRWRAEFDAESLSFRFNDPETLFDAGSAQLTPAFEQILAEFAPLLFEALDEESAYLDINSIRIEGHTSSEWLGSSRKLPSNVAHIRNMALSQDRAFSVVKHLSQMPEISTYWKNWTRRRIQALGVGPNRLIYDADNRENSERSRRVEVWIVPRETVHEFAFPPPPPSTTNDEF